MQEQALTEGEVARRTAAAEAVKAVFPETWVGASFSNENRSFDPWVINCRASVESLRWRQAAFSPLHQRPTAPLGRTGVAAGHVVVGSTCPGIFTGFFHADGAEALERFVVDRKDSLILVLDREIERLKKEIGERDVVCAPGTEEPSEEQLDRFIAHLEAFLADTELWKAKVSTGDLSLSSLPKDW